MASAPTLLVRANVRLELLKIETYWGNRLAFEQQRRALDEMRDRMRPSIAADFNYKLGIGYRRFGQEGRAEQALREAYAIATEHGLGVWRRRIEHALRQATAGR